MGQMCQPCLNRDGAESVENKRRMEAEVKLNKLIDSDIGKSEALDQNTVKLLLLGSGESGKSTLFKQIVQLYGRGYADEVRAPFKTIIHANILLSLKTLIKQSQLLLEAGHDVAMSEAVGVSARSIMDAASDKVVDTAMANHVKAVWEDNGIRNTFKLRSMYQILDAIPYFLDRIEEIGKANYLPTYQDVLHCRARTTGIVETHFEIEDTDFLMLDVGGQRNERKKWIHCFEDVTAVIFVAAMSEYDQVLYEDETTNRVRESLELFGEICNSRWFRETAMVLFLNKKDLFQKKLPKVPLEKYFEDYKGGSDFQEGANFLTDKFLAQNKYAAQKKVYVHVTCATDTANIAFTFNVVKDIIISLRLKSCGLFM